MNEVNIRDRFARNLKTIRRHQGVTQDVMASTMQVKRSTYSGYENGTAEPSLDFLHALQHRFGFGVDLLLNADLHELSDWQWMQIKSGAGARTIQAQTTIRHDNHG